MELDTPNPTGSDEEFDGDDPRMTDLVKLEPVANAAHGAFLCAVLEDHEIPAVVESGAVGGMFAGVAGIQAWIMVPRELASRAREVVDRNKKEIAQKGVSEAFEAEDLYDECAVDDDEGAILQQCQDIGMLSEEARDARLKLLLQKWSETTVLPATVARRLAAAGLTREQADRLIQELQKDAPQVSEWRRILGGIGVLLALCGSVMLAAGNFGGGGIIVLAIIFFFWASSINPPRWQALSKEETGTHDGKNESPGGPGQPPA